MDGETSSTIQVVSASRGRRIYVAHVIADLIRTELGELRADADPRRTPIAGQRSGDQTAERVVERFDQRLR
jgi:hypothetical protein